MSSYREVLGKVEGLQRGFTSGTCAQAVARGAAELLLSGEIRPDVRVRLRKGLELTLPLIHQKISEGSAFCGILKDSGDDDDITHGKEFCAEVSWSDDPGIHLEGGKGIGRVTREGLSTPVGEAAINPNPRRMIKSALEPLLEKASEKGLPPGFRVVLSVPEGEELAKETWNPRIGIEGGISIIGTSGIIEPKSSAAFKASIAVLLKMAAKKDISKVTITPGYVGEAYLRKYHALEEEDMIKVGDHVGFALKSAASKDFKEILFVGHIGKMAKVASGLFDTHCKYGDARLETVAACAAAAGASRDDVRTLLDMKMAEASVSFLQDRGLQEAFDIMNRRLIERCFLHIKKNLTFTSVILDLKGEPLSTVTVEGKGYETVSGKKG